MLHTHAHTSSYIYTHYYFVSRVGNIFYVSSFIVVEYKFVLFVRLVLNVYFVRAVLRPLFVSYLHSFISLASFIYYYIHVPILCLYYKWSTINEFPNRKTSGAVLCLTPFFTLMPPRSQADSLLGSLCSLIRCHIAIEDLNGFDVD